LNSSRSSSEHKDAAQLIIDPQPQPVRRRFSTETIFNSPKPRQDWVNGKFVKIEEKSEEFWVELFIDLVYVVLLSKLSSLFHGPA
jgi:hypothetical protein